MGQDLRNATSTAADRAASRAALRQETGQLKTWCDERRFAGQEVPTAGLEIEGWLVDENHLPAPLNAAFLAAADDPEIVAELSKFNFEINAPPLPLTGDVLARTRSGLEATWRRCRDVACGLGLRPVTIGMLPTVRDEMLQPAWMSASKRYEALSRELFARRRAEPLHIDIAGQDHLDYRCDHLMLEAACTSLQVHLAVAQEEAARLYNAAVLAAGPLVAASANSPFLYGRSLWAETRIPAFEQATAMLGFRDLQGRNVRRVTLGTGYLRQSMLELFVENLSYPDLLPEQLPDDGRLRHLRLQNGTVWRWVRPIVGFDNVGTPHLRLEHRVMPAGPSIADMVANIALCHGLVLALGRQDTPPEEIAPFEAVRSNFYACARHGLDARISWAGRTVGVQQLLLDTLLPAARAALDDAGVAPEDLALYVDDILHRRLLTGRTGTAWQRGFVDLNGPNWQALTERYVAHQAGGRPVHEWTA